MWAKKSVRINSSGMRMYFNEKKYNEYLFPQMRVSSWIENVKAIKHFK